MLEPHTRFWQLALLLNVAGPRIEAHLRACGTGFRAVTWRLLHLAAEARAQCILQQRQQQQQLSKMQEDQEAILRASVAAGYASACSDAATAPSRASAAAAAAADADADELSAMDEASVRQQDGSRLQQLPGSVAGQSQQQQQQHQESARQPPQDSNFSRMPREAQIVAALLKFDLQQWYSLEKEVAVTFQDMEQQLQVAWHNMQQLQSTPAAGGFRITL